MEAKEKKTKRQKRLRIIAIIAASAVLAFAVWQLCKIGDNYRRGIESYEAVEDAAVVDEDDFTLDWDELHAMNEDIIAWIRVPGLDISYPVVQGEDNNQYLRNGLDGEYLVAGCIFVDYRNLAFADMNTIIYGHNMRNGTMFAALHELENADTQENVTYFLIYTPDATYRYDIFSCYNTPDVGYKVYHGECDEYAEYIENLQECSVYDTGITVDGADHIVTLSTCTSYGKRYQYRWIVSGVFSGVV